MGARGGGRGWDMGAEGKTAKVRTQQPGASWFGETQAGYRQAVKSPGRAQRKLDWAGCTAGCEMYCASCAPAAAQYRSSLPTGMARPLMPRSPRPRMREPSVTTMAWGCHGEGEDEGGQAKLGPCVKRAPLSLWQCPPTAGERQMTDISNHAHHQENSPGPPTSTSCWGQLYTMAAWVVEGGVQVQGILSAEGPATFIMPCPASQSPG